MEKEKNHHDLNLRSKRKTNEETLEISSTGYGYVINETEEQRKLHKKK
jgi:hypothetical protein